MLMRKQKQRIMMIIALIFCLMIAGSLHAATPTTITRATLLLYQEEGYLLDDIYAAESLALLYDYDFFELLEARKAGKTWMEIIQDLSAKVQMKKGYEPLTQSTVELLLNRGYKANDIATSDLMGKRFNKNAIEILIVKQKQEQWINVFYTLYEYEQVSVQEKAVRMTQNKVSAMYIKYDKQINANALQTMSDRKYTEYDVQRTMELCQRQNVEIELVLKVKNESIDWGVTEALIRYLKAD